MKHGRIALLKWWEPGWTHVILQDWYAGELVAQTKGTPIPCTKRARGMKDFLKRNEVQFVHRWEWPLDDFLTHLG